MLNVYSIAFLVLTSDMRTIRIHHEHVFFASAMGSQQIGLAFKLTTQSKHTHAFARICAHSAS